MLYVRNLLTRSLRIRRGLETLCTSAAPPVSLSTPSHLPLFRRQIAPRSRISIRETKNQPHMISSDSDSMLTDCQLSKTEGTRLQFVASQTPTGVSSMFLATRLRMPRELELLT